MGHLICAQEAHSQLELDVVVFVPVGRASHRTIEHDPGAEARFQMCEWAVGADARFGVSRIEIDREGLSYTVETLRAVHDESAEDLELFLILGGDQAATLARWHEPEVVLELSTVAVVERTNWSRHAIGITLGRLPRAREIRYLEMPVIQISSSSIRRRAAAGLPIRYLVPERVAAHIEANGLYGASVSEGAPA